MKEMVVPMSELTINKIFPDKESHFRDELRRSGKILTPGVALAVADLVDCANKNNSSESVKKRTNECIEMVGISKELAEGFYNVIYGPEVEQGFTSNKRQTMEEFFHKNGLYSYEN